MYQNMHNFRESRSTDASSLARHTAAAQVLESPTQIAVQGSLMDELRHEAAGALFALGAWVAPRKPRRVTTPAQLRHSVNSGIAG